MKNNRLQHINYLIVAISFCLLSIFPTIAGAKLAPTCADSPAPPTGFVVLLDSGTTPGYGTTEDAAISMAMNWGISEAGVAAHRFRKMGYRVSKITVTLKSTSSYGVYNYAVAEWKIFGTLKK